MNQLIAIFQFVPVLVEAIKAIEAAVPGAGKGEQKLAAIREILEQVDASYSALWPKLSGIVGVLVKLFNATGELKKG